MNAGINPQQQAMQHFELLNELILDTSIIPRYSIRVSDCIESLSLAFLVILYFILRYNLKGCIYRSRRMRQTRSLSLKLLPVTRSPGCWSTEVRSRSSVPPATSHSLACVSTINPHSKRTLSISWKPSSVDIHSAFLTRDTNYLQLLNHKMWRRARSIMVNIVYIL